VASEELAVTREELCGRKVQLRASGSLHVERLTIRIVWAAGDVVQLQVGKGRYEGHAVVGAQPRKWQIAAIEVHDKGLGLAHSHMPERVVRVGLRVQPAFALDWQSRDMTGRAPNLPEERFAPRYCRFDSRVVWDDATRYGNRGLEERQCSDIGASHFVGDAVVVVAIGTEVLSDVVPGVDVEAFLRLNAM